MRADQIRLQREDVLFMIAEKARARLVMGKAPTTALPLKTIVPLLGKASLEEPTDEFMLSKWADLLVSGATTQNVHPRFITILAELTGDRGGSGS